MTVVLDPAFAYGKEISLFSGFGFVQQYPSVSNRYFVARAQPLSDTIEETDPDSAAIIKEPHSSGLLKGTNRDRGDDDDETLSIYLQALMTGALCTGTSIGLSAVPRLLWADT